MKRYFPLSETSMRVGTLSFVFLWIAACDNSSPMPPRLAELSVSGGSGALYPSFDPEIFDYAVVCQSADVINIEARASIPRQFVSVNSDPARLSFAAGEVVSLSTDQDIYVDVSAGVTRTRYTVHCTPNDLPEIDVLYITEGVDPGLLYLTPQFIEDGIRQTYLLIIDNNAVPRFARKIDARAVDFKRHPNGRYSYARQVGLNEFGLNDYVIVVLDEEFNQADELTTVGLNHTDNHDVILLDNGGAILLSYNSTIRDMTAYGLSSEELVGDSVIQEVDAQGNIVLEWNSWDYIDLADCVESGFRRFPTDYAHVNSVKLTPERDLIASFRGCSQVIKIDRPTGDVIWYFGGTQSSFDIVGDPFGEFCGQHTAYQIGSDTVLLFDNGSFCLGDRELLFGQFSRAVEYRLDHLASQANFVRDYSRDNAYQEFTGSQGSVQLLSNGSWLIGWGSGPDIAVTEVDSSGEKLFELRLSVNGSTIVSYRAFREQ